MSKYKMANEQVGLGKTEDLGDSNLVNALNTLLNNTGAEMRDLHLDRSGSKLDTHFNNFTQWSTDRKICLLYTSPSPRD